LLHLLSQEHSLRRQEWKQLLLRGTQPMRLENSLLATRSLENNSHGSTNNDLWTGLLSAFDSWVESV
jgi:hypothetical protein